MKSKLTFLDITSENYSELDNIDQYKDLDSLHITCNLTEIPVLKGLGKLRLLNLSENEIQSLDGLKNLRNLKNLEELHLDKNPIDVFSGLKYIKDLPHLKMLSLYSNKIKSLTLLKILSNLKSLERLYLGYNLVENLDGLEQLKTLSNLKSLDLSGNNITILDISRPVPPSLNKLNLSENPISQVVSLGGFKEHKTYCGIERFRLDKFTDANIKQFLDVAKGAGFKIRKGIRDYDDKYDVEIIDLWKPEPRPPPKEFKVNKHITLKLDHKGRTILYVDNEKFRQCHYLLIKISLDSLNNSKSEINSIDDLEENPNYSLEFSQDSDGGSIPPDAEFWGHSSNLQAWCELNYDTRILHRNLAFPLLKRLTEIGDKKA